MYPFGTQQQHNDIEDQVEMQKRMAKMERFERKKLKEQEDMVATVWWMCAISCAHAFCLLVAIFGSSWAWAQFTGSGASMITIRTSMFMLDVQVECGNKNPIENKVCDAMSPIMGTHLISKSRAMFGSMSQAPAQLMNWIFYSNLLIFFFFIFAAAFHMISASLLYYYWKECPLPKVRQWAQVFWVAAPIAGALGLILWSIINPDLREIPESVTKASSALTGGLHIIGFVPVNAMMPYGWCWFWSVWWIFVQLCTLTVWPCFFHRHAGEEVALMEEENAKDMALQEGLMAYGAVDEVGLSSNYSNTPDLGGYQQGPAPQQYQYQAQGSYQQYQPQGSYQQQSQAQQYPPQGFPQDGYNYGQQPPHQSSYGSY